MENSLNEYIETNTDENLLIIKSYVDEYIVYFKAKYNLEQRNQLIMEVLKIAEKKYIASPNAKFESNRRSILGTLTKSYITQKLFKEKKSLENPN